MQQNSSAPQVPNAVQHEWCRLLFLKSESTQLGKGAIHQTRPQTLWPPQQCTLNDLFSLLAMCTSLFLLDDHPELLLLVLFNRDEFFHRYCVPSDVYKATCRLPQVRSYKPDSLQATICVPHSLVSLCGK